MQDQPLWFKDAIFYELHIRSFFDSDDDGIGDFRGLTAKLDYLQDLGVTALWILPFYPSPLRDDGYDISDYTGIHSAYGDLADFKIFMKEAHRRGFAVVTELVLNHTSDQHPWFQKARAAAAGSTARNFYVWNGNADKYKEARIIFKDFETSNWSWDRAAQAYYWHRFYSHQPDLNFDHPAVRKALVSVVDFWLKLGVDGLRLDAIPYLFERDGTHCENLPETHAFLKELRRHVDAKYPNRVLLAEANQWPEEAIHYFGAGDECHMAFHFPVMPRLFMAIRMEDQYPIADILQQTPAIPENCQWALFLRNHDELTLEMVTDEERDYMYRVYANDPQARINLGIRRRLAPLLGNHRRKMELMNGLLFSLPGTPVIYYGDEIGMGDNIRLGDRNGVRTPMQWNGNRNAGFSNAHANKLYLSVNTDPEYHFETLNVETQQANVHSLLWWMKRMIVLRKRFKAFSRGTLEMLSPENRKILVFIRKFGEETVLAVFNLSRFVQYVELDLAAYRGTTPVEMFGQTEFPPIGELPYFLTLGPHSFYWFKLEPKRAPGSAPPADRAWPRLQTAEHWTRVLRPPFLPSLEAILPSFLSERRTLNAPGRKLKRAEIFDSVRLEKNGGAGWAVALVRAEFAEGEPERYPLYLSFCEGPRAEEIKKNFPECALAEVLVKTGQKSRLGLLYEAFADRDFPREMMASIRRGRRFKGGAGEIAAKPSRLPGPGLPADEIPEPSPLKSAASNTTFVFGDRFVLKFFRRLEPGVNPDLEIVRHLNERKNFPHVPTVAGTLEYRAGRAGAEELSTLAVAHLYIPHEDTAWEYTLDAVGTYYERVLSKLSAAPGMKPSLAQSAFALSRQEADPLAVELINPYLETARLLGRRTAELHRALAGETEDPAFTPEPFTSFYQRSLYHSMRSLADQAFQLLSKKLKHLPEPLGPVAQAVYGKKDEIQKRFRALMTLKISADRIRCHGNYHLREILYTGKDFVIIDFEGEASRPSPERKIKRSALRDLAGMLHSFHYAAQTSLFEDRPGGKSRPEDIPALEPWLRFWVLWVSSAFLRAYLDSTRGEPFLPAEKDFEPLLNLYLLEKAIYDMRSELLQKPERAGTPMKAILHLVGAAPEKP
jgi:maltose alpha-D-glucosyltransferase/alpha-amylase